MPTGLGDELLWLCPSLDDSPNDLSGNGNNGTYVNGVSTVADSDPTYGGSRAYNFDGTDDYIQTTLSDTDWRPSNGDFTVSGWYKSKNKYATGYIFNDGAVSLGQASNFNRATAGGLAPTGYVNFANPMYPNSGFVWRHFIMTFTDGAVKAYQNGVFEVEIVQGYDVTVNAQSYDARIGYVNPVMVANALTDDLRVYNRVLTGAEITLLASARGVLGGLGGGGTHTQRTLLGVG